MSISSNLQVLFSKVLYSHGQLHISLKSGKKKWANAYFKIKIHYFALFSKLIREVSIF